MEQFLNSNYIVILFLMFFGLFSFVFSYLEQNVTIKNKITKTIVAVLSALVMSCFTTLFFDFIIEPMINKPSRESFSTNDLLKDFDAITESNNMENDVKDSVEIKTTEMDIQKTIYLENINVSDSGKYEGNQGDSFIYKLGSHKWSRGITDINGESYFHGLEVWIARWNHVDEISWAYSTFDLDNQYTVLSGKMVLIDSYNTTNFNATLYFYNNEELIQQYSLTPDTIPFDLKVDITGVKQLTIFVKDNIAVSGGTSFGLIDCILEEMKE